MQLINIHLLWEIDEYVKISLRIIWLKPPKAPTMADREVKSTIILMFRDAIKIMGAIFCHVNTIKAWIQDKLIITWGNQKWRGAIPAFNAKAVASKASDTSKLILSLLANNIIAGKIKKIEASAWARKYLIAASVKFGLNLFSIRGIILIRLISSASQAVNHEFAEIATKVLVTRIERNRVWKFFKNIKKKEILLL